MQYFNFYVPSFINAGLEKKKNKYHVWTDLKIEVFMVLKTILTESKY